MGFLANKRILVTGMISNRSIAYGVASHAHRGAELAFTYQDERAKDRVITMAKEFGSELVLPCDVSSDAESRDCSPLWDNTGKISTASGTPLPCTVRGVVTTALGSTEGLIVRNKNAAR